MALHPAGGEVEVDWGRKLESAWLALADAEHKHEEHARREQ